MLNYLNKNRTGATISKHKSYDETGFPADLQTCRAKPNKLTTVQVTLSFLIYFRLESHIDACDVVMMKDPHGK
jgi:hypothetical protein